MARDPRTSSRYQRARRAYIAQHTAGATCCLCGHGIDTTLSGSSPWGPTIEHHVKVWLLTVHARSWDDLVTMACDTSTWGLAHRQCQARQGAQVTNAKRRQASDLRRRPAW